MSDIDADPDRDSHRKSAYLGEDGMHGRTIDELQNQVVLRGNGVVASSQSSNEIGVRQQSAQSGFTIEPADELAGVREMIREQLHRDSRSKREIVTEEYGTHPALPNRAE